MTDKIDWNDNAIAAVKEFASYIGNSNSVYRFIRGREKLPTEPIKSKTVHDAVEYHNGVWPHVYLKFLNFDKTRDCWFCSDNELLSGFVCTREEFEKVAAEKKWTHKTSSGYECRIIHEHEGYAWIEYKDIDMQLISPVSGLKPIKPTITKAEAWDKVIYLAKCHGSNFGHAVEVVLEKYNITN